MDTPSSITKHAPVVALAIGIAGFGVLSLISGDFGFQWQPVAKDLADRANWALTAGIAELVIALALILPATRIFAAAAAAALYLFWSGLHAPPMIEKPTNVAAWLGAAEPFAIAMGALSIAFVDTKSQTLFGLCVRAFGAACVIFGASHFAYAEFTATMVPSWLPERLLLAYATGAVHAGCGVALFVGAQRPFAAVIEAMMMTSFILLVHIPRIAIDPSNRFEWTMAFAAVLLSASAWIIAAELQTKPAA